MRISDWSSDVCASDLEQGARVALVAVRLRAVDQRSPVARGLRHVGLGLVAEMAEAAGELQAVGGVPGQLAVDRGLPAVFVLAVVEVDVADHRAPYSRHRRVPPPTAPAPGDDPACGEALGP